MIVDEIAALLDAAGFGTLTVDLVKGAMPDTPDTVLVVGETVGGRGVHVFGEPGPAVEEPGLMIRMRGVKHDYQTPRDRIEAVYQHLSALGAFTAGGVRYLDLTARQPPFPLGKDMNNRWVFSVNFDAQKELSTS